MVNRLFVGPHILKMEGIPTTDYAEQRLCNLFAHYAFLSVVLYWRYTFKFASKLCTCTHTHTQWPLLSRFHNLHGSYAYISFDQIKCNYAWKKHAREIILKWNFNRKYVKCCFDFARMWIWLHFNDSINRDVYNVNITWKQLWVKRR